MSFSEIHARHPGADTTSPAGRDMMRVGGILLLVLAVGISLAASAGRTPVAQPDAGQDWHGNVAASDWR